MSGYLILCLFALGMYGLIACRNLIKKLIALNICNSAVVLLFVYTGSLQGTTAPIRIEQGAAAVDPLPQALMLTAIVVGICVTALCLCFLHHLYRDYQSLDIVDIQRRRASRHA